MSKIKHDDFEKLLNDYLWDNIPPKLVEITANTLDVVENIKIGSYNISNPVHQIQGTADATYNLKEFGSFTSPIEFCVAVDVGEDGYEILGKKTKIEADVSEFYE
ncbi:MAG: hypothetical protein FWB74_09350 [Defluviitaleaceae bacterium]|nr:hypothetical protein [Defluviitaleaceae bacterium]